MTTIDIRPAAERFVTELDWLDSKHSFSFGHHRDPNNVGHGLLVVNNDDVVSQRDVDPARLFTDNGVTYLQGWCHRAHGARTFRLERILEAGVLDEPATHQARVREPEPYRPDSSEVVAIDLAPTARWLAEQVPVESVTDLAEGAFRIELRVGGSAWLRALLLREAHQVRAVTPASAAHDAAQAAREALEAYERLGLSP